MASRTPSRSASRGRTRSHSQSSRRRSASPGGSASPKTNSRSRSHSRVARDARNGYRSDRERSRSPAKSTKIVVEKLTKNVMEDHLRELFGSFGVIREIDMPMNTQFNTNRGTAYIMYDDANDAETAMIKMHEGQLDGATLNVSAVLPHRKFSPSPPPARRLAAHLDRIENNNSRRRAPPPPPPRRGGLPPPRYRSPPPRRDFSPPRRYRGGPPGVDTWRPQVVRDRFRGPCLALLRQGVGLATEGAIVHLRQQEVEDEGGEVQATVATIAIVIEAVV
ncbi:MAG: hypothetical protein M1831_007534 [Alyxoria varia]|nr:MAG: hypothetical protein M1831_007534 [Alyxoria varia]